MRNHHPHASLLSRQFKELCPIFNHTNSGEGVLENLINRQMNEKLYHDRRSHTLEDIPTGSTAAVLDHHSNSWILGIYLTGLIDDTQWSCPLEG